jgi:excisionase family DNA binding protein
MVTTMEGWLAPAQAARALGVADSTVRGMVKRGQLAALRTPIGIVIKTEDVERLAQQRAEQGG